MWEHLTNLIQPPDPELEFSYEDLQEENKELRKELNMLYSKLLPAPLSVGHTVGAEKGQQQHVKNATPESHRGATHSATSSCTSCLPPCGLGGAIKSGSPSKLSFSSATAATTLPQFTLTATKEEQLQLQLHSRQAWGVADRNHSEVGITLLEKELVAQQQFIAQQSKLSEENRIKLEATIEELNQVKMDNMQVTNCRHCRRAIQSTS